MHKRVGDKNDDLNTNFIFAYWESDDHSLISEMTAAWRSAFPAFRVFGDADILPMIEELQPEFVDTYRRIRIPAAKSDVARLLVLYKFGGLYIDCHMGILSSESLAALFDRLNAIDHIFVDRRLQMAPRHPEEHFLINGMMMSRPGCTHILDMARQAMSNLAWQRQVEARDGFTQYSIYHFCGAILINSMTLQPGTCNREVRRDLASRVLIIREEEFPVERNRYGSYHVAGKHWSEREKTELLFEP